MASDLRHAPHMSEAMTRVHMFRGSGTSMGGDDTLCQRPPVVNNKASTAIVSYAGQVAACPELDPLEVISNPKQWPAHLQLTPSHYMSDVLLGFGKKFVAIRNTDLNRTLHVLSDACHSSKVERVGVMDVLFQPIPSVIYFQNYEPLKSYEVPLVFRNLDVKSRRVQLMCSESQYFQVVGPTKAKHRVGAGLTAKFLVRFSPDIKKEYCYQVVCVTDCEQFIIPVCARGARAVLDFPDEVLFPVSAVKNTVSKTILVRNIGDASASVCLEVSKPFTITPETATISIGGLEQFDVTYSPPITGHHVADLIVKYSTGDVVHIPVRGTSQDIPVRLTKNSLIIEPTYMSLSSQKQLAISNRSDVVVHFRWTNFATPQAEDQHRTTLLSNLTFEGFRSQFVSDCREAGAGDLMDCVVTNAFDSQRRLILEDKLMFKDESFEILPLEGDVWPGTSLDITVVFKPKQRGHHHMAAFCDVVGRETRLPLVVNAEGLGPRVQLSIDTLDIGNVFSTTAHMYEVVLANTGHIHATCHVTVPDTPFGRCLNVEPADVVLPVDGLQSLTFNFAGDRLGTFDETVLLEVEGNGGNPVKMQFSGCVISPTFHFDVDCLNFGAVAYGFTSTKICTLTNTSHIPLHYRFYILDDGDHPAVSFDADADADAEPSSLNMNVNCNSGEMSTEAPSTASAQYIDFFTKPKEFVVSPNSGVLDAQSFVLVTVSLCSNTVSRYMTSLAVDLDEVGEKAFLLPISAKCIVPTISLLTPKLYCGRCCLRSPYETNVKLQNSSPLPAAYHITAQCDADQNEITSLRYCTPKPNGVIMGQSCLSIPLQVTPMTPGKLEETVSVTIAGHDNSLLIVEVSCCGVGPVVMASPSLLDWETIPVLVNVEKHIQLSNESPVPARFKASLVRPGSVWMVAPSEGEIPPKGSVELCVIACFNDTLRFIDKVQIEIDEGDAQYVDVTGCGQGGTLVTLPPLPRTLHLGPSYCGHIVRYSFALLNRGRRSQTVLFQTAGFKQPPRVSIRPKKNGKSNTTESDVAGGPVFKIKPFRFEISPEESTQITFEGCVDGEPRKVEEVIELCTSSPGGRMEALFKTKVKCSFIVPMIKFSLSSIDFRVEQDPRTDMTIQSQDLEVTNITGLPLTAIFTTKYPFYITSFSSMYLASCDATEVVLQPCQSTTIVVQFDPLFRDDLYIRMITDQLQISYKEHSHVDVIPMRGEVYFPNLRFECSSLIINFGCILNDTEATRFITVTNNSPLDVKYQWSFQLDDPNQPVAVFHHESWTKAESSSALMLNADEKMSSLQLLDIGEEKIIIQSETSDEMGGRLAAIFEEGASFEQLPVALEEAEDEAAETEATEAEAAEAEVAEAEDEDEERQSEESDLNKWEADDIGHAESAETLMSIVPAAEVVPGANPELASYMATANPQDASLSVEEIFDISPLFGTLKPGATERVTLTFYGHAFIESQVVAVCKVENGPNYELPLKGRASLVHYKFSTQDVDYGPVMYNKVAVAELTLYNLGHVSFTFEAIGTADPLNVIRMQPGVPVLVPHSGSVESLSEVVLRLHYLPSSPAPFKMSFKIHVAPYEPETIWFYGGASYPQLLLNLPRPHNEMDGCRAEFYRQAIDNVSTYLENHSKIIREPPAIIRHLDAKEDSRPATCQASVEDYFQEGIGVLQHEREMRIEMELDRLILMDYIDRMSYEGTINIPFSNKESSRQQDLTLHAKTCGLSAAGSTKRRRKVIHSKPRLPEYLLDFGPVILGTVEHRTLVATNSGICSVSFSVEQTESVAKGFTFLLDVVAQLPPKDFVHIVVSFDPRKANLDVGPIEAVVLINLCDGPQLCIRLMATVTSPSVNISTDSLDFGCVHCGECRIQTIQLNNAQSVPCRWEVLSSNVTGKQKSAKTAKNCSPLRSKLKPYLPSWTKVFEIMPAVGCLQPGERANVQVKFVPLVEKLYESRLVICVAQSSQRLTLLCNGNGIEPDVIFDRPVVEFTPVIPHYAIEEEIVVCNPCRFAVELYSLEYDKIYLEDEKILRTIAGNEKCDVIYLPPRVAGERLPTELMEAYEEHLRKFEENEQLRKASVSAASPTTAGGSVVGDESVAVIAAGATAPATTPIMMPAVLAEVPRSSVMPDQATAAAAPNETIKVDMLVTTSDSHAAERRASEAAAQEGVATDAEVDEGISHVIDVPLTTLLYTPQTLTAEMELSPVSAAIARHIGINLTPEGLAARNRRGIAVIIHGPPLSGKTVRARALAQYYNAAILTLDEIVTEALFYSGTPAAVTARQLCLDASRDMDDSEQAVLTTQPTEKLSQKRQSVLIAIQNKQSKGKVNQELKSQKSNVNEAKSGLTPYADLSPLDPSGVLPILGPTARSLGCPRITSRDDALTSTVLPDELVAEIIAERLQREDTWLGVIFDGLESIFTQNYVHSLFAVLKAINNRKFIYAITLKLDHTLIKERERLLEEEKERRAAEELAEQREWLTNMSEEEYNELTPEQQAEVDRVRLEHNRDRMKRTHEARKEREKKAEEARQAEQRRLEEERAAKNKKKKGAGVDAKKSGLPPTIVKSVEVKPSAGKTAETAAEGGSPERSKKDKKGHIVEAPVAEDLEMDTNALKEATIEADTLLKRQCLTFDHFLRDACNLLEHWERQYGAARSAAIVTETDTETIPEIHHASNKEKHEGKRAKAEKEKEDKKEKQSTKDIKPSLIETVGMSIDTEASTDRLTAVFDDKKERRNEELGVPNTIINCSVEDDPKAELDPPTVIATCKLPLADEVLDGLGIGPSGPAIPPPVTLAVVPYPITRRPPSTTETTHLCFVPPLDDPSQQTVAAEQKVHDAADGESNADTIHDVSPSPMVSKGGRRQDKKDAQSDGGGRKEKKLKSVPSTAGRNKGKAMSQLVLSVNEAERTESVVETELAAHETKPPEVAACRWVIPPNGSVSIRVRFMSPEAGHFDEVLNFEIVTTKRRYELHFRAVCAFPTINQAPRVIFPCLVKTKSLADIVCKSYVLSTKTFEFGPLLAGKPVDRTEMNASNMEKFTFENVSPLDVHATFCLMNESVADTFFFEPAAMILEPGQKQELTMWAFPQKPGVFEETFVACFRENPQPYVIKLMCLGVHPELEIVDKKLAFDRVLLHRKETRSLVLKNTTMLPVSWHLTGLETLGEEFIIPVKNGIIKPFTTVNVDFSFLAHKSVMLNKKAIKLEVLDVDGVMGVLQSETIPVTGEAYDVVLDISFPKGSDGCVDYDIVRVRDECRQVCMLKNKGKYEIAFVFTVEPTPSCPRSICRMFSVLPSSGTLGPNDKPLPLQVIVCTQREINVKDQPILRCHVIEPKQPVPPGPGNTNPQGALQPASLPAQGGSHLQTHGPTAPSTSQMVNTSFQVSDAIANIPIRVSCQSAYSRYAIVPAEELQFGAMILNSKKSRTFTIENHSNKFELKFTIGRTKIEPHTAVQLSSKEDRKNSSAVGASKHLGVGRTESAMARLTAGVFTVYPTTGTVPSNGQQIINVDCIAEQLGNLSEDIYIDISNRGPDDHPGGIKYHLGMESCFAGFDVDDVGSIFEEHHVCKSLGSWYCSNYDTDGCGVYIQDDKRFMLTNVLVGTHAKARFKIKNTTKIPCDVTITMKAPPTAPGVAGGGGGGAGAKAAGKQLASSDIFEVEPTHAQIAPGCHIYAVVTFSPQALQTYTAVFDASVDAVPSGGGKNPQSAAPRSLTFEVVGEGCLPSMHVAVPELCDKHGQPLLLFRRLLIGQSQTLPLVLTNSGSLLCKVNLTLCDSDGVFAIRPVSDICNQFSECMAANKAAEEATVSINGDKQQAQRLSAFIPTDSGKAEFEVTFTPREISHCVGRVVITLASNLYENTAIMLVGEGYEESVTIEDVPCCDDMENITYDDSEENPLPDDFVLVPRCSTLCFGYTYMNEPKTISLTLSNRSKTDCVRFVWPSHPVFTFAPQIGHLHPDKSKRISVTLYSDKPCNIKAEPLNCIVTKIMFAKPLDEVGDWDDLVKVVKWVDAVPDMTSDSFLQQYGSGPTFSNAVISTGPLSNATPTPAFQQKTSRQSKAAIRSYSISAPSEVPPPLLPTSLSVSIEACTMKKKITEVAPEPYNVEISLTTRPIELLVSGIVDYSQFSLTENDIHFRDTLMFQTRIHHVELRNTGGVQLEYSWRIEMTEKHLNVAKPVVPPTTVPFAFSQQSIAQQPSMKSIMSTAKSPVPGAVGSMRSMFSGASLLTGAPMSPLPPTDEILTPPVTPMLPTNPGEEQGYVPFTVVPASGVIVAGGTAELLVKFSSLDVSDFYARLVARITNLEPGVLEPVIRLAGRSLLPFCHVDFENSDYITAGRRDPNLRGPKGTTPGSGVDPETHVVELKVLGTGVTANCQFSVVNPTDVPYSFQWVNRDEVTDIKKPLPFRCCFPRGTIGNGQQKTMAFTFTSSTTSLVESFWDLVLPDHDITIPFLLVAHVSEPDVLLEKSHVNFGTMLIGLGATKTVYIVNNDDESFQFNIVESSLYSPGHVDQVRVSPMRGILAPKSRQLLTLSYTAKIESEVSFNVQCKVERKATNLMLNIKADGYSLSCMVACFDVNGNRKELSASVASSVDLGQVNINELIMRNFTISNGSRFGFDYTWEMVSRQLDGCVTLEPMSGHVEHAQASQCVLSYRSNRPLVLRDCKITLKITYGPMYTILVSARTVVPDLELSFDTYNFGRCFIYDAGMPVNSTTLHLTNVDNDDLSVTCLYEPNAVLVHDFEPCLLPPNKSRAVTFSFYPREQTKYRETVTFEINGLSKKSVEFRGTGVELKVEVVNPKHKTVRFGSPLVGQSVVRSIPIVNRSSIPINVLLSLTTHNQTFASMLSLETPGTLTLPPPVVRFGKKIEQPVTVRVMYSPSLRTKQFAEELIMEYGGHYETLFLMTASALGMEISLSTNTLAFGLTVPRSSCTRKLILSNTGDIGSKFQWNASKFAPDFSITPVEGYITQGMDIGFDVTFHPHQISNGIRYENLHCKIDDLPPLRLTLTGSCAAIPPAKEVYNFVATVRTKETKNLSVANKSTIHWNLKPIIEGDYFSGSDILEVPPQTTQLYELTYFPQVMTLEGKKHVGSVFFALPDGTGLEFSVTGSADPPKPIAKIVHDVPCKTEYVEPLTVTNWLPKTQRFRMKVEYIKPEKPDPTTTIKGLDYVDVPGKSSVDYKLHFNAFKEAQYQLKVIFISEKTGEYQFYEVMLRSIKPTVIAVINLTTSVRQRKHHSLVLDNPLPVLANLSVTTNIPDIQMPLTFAIPPQMEGTFTFEYFPLKIGLTQGKLEFNSNELGNFPFELNLHALPSGSERELYFRTSLGSSITQTAKFVNYAKTKTDYAIKLDHADFRAEKSIPAAPTTSTLGIEVSFDVTFEPTGLGESHTTLVLNSPVGGDYSFPLHGVCTMPRPQGPFTVKPGAPLSINFRNVFSTPVTFAFTTDNPAFRVTKPEELIRPHKESKISVSFEIPPSQKVPILAKLVVGCAKPYTIPNASAYHWLFYLRGEAKDSK